MFNDIKKMLRIKDKNIQMMGVSEETYKGHHTLILHARLSPAPHACPACGSEVENEKGNRQIVKNGTKKTTIRFEAYNHLPTVMKLAKQRYFCKACLHHWTAQTYFVDAGCVISKHIRFKIMDLLKEKISLTLIAKLCQVSLTTVLRVLKSLEVYLPNRRSLYLPKVLMVDEFRSHTSLEDKMSFICADGQTGELIDILPSRKLKKLVTYFQKSQNTADVHFLVTDMNAAYFQLVTRVFPNARLIIDRFHIVKHLNESFNRFRVREVNRLKQTNQKSEAAKLKTNWRYFLKNRSTIQVSEYKTWRSFRAPKYPYMTEAMMIDRLLDFSPSLKEAYNVFQDLTDAFREKESDQFFQLLHSLPKSLDDSFRSSLENLLSYEDGIRNAMIYPYSNGKIEAKNTHIKTLKRVSYGFKSFKNMKIRIFLLNGLLKMTN